MSTARIELWRRAVLVAGTAGAVAAATWTGLGPLVEVESFGADAARRRLLAGAWVSQEERALADLPDRELLAVTVRGKLERSEAPRWKDVLRELATGREQLFLRLDQPPVAELRPRLAMDGAIRYVLVGGDDVRPGLLRVTRRDVTVDDFQLGSGWSGGRRPPDRLLFPWRWLAPWLAIGGLVGYLLLPWRRRKPNEVHYARSRLVPGDVLGVVLLVGVGALPMLITGGSLQTALAAWPLLLFLWPLAAMGGVMLYYTGWWSAFSLEVGEAELGIETARRRLTIPYADIRLQRPAVLRLPRWFRMLQWIAVILAPAARRPGAAGAALIYGGALSTGTALILRDDSTLYLWGTAPSGGSMLTGAAVLEAALAEVPLESEVVEVRSLTMPLRGRPSDRAA